MYAVVNLGAFAVVSLLAARGAPPRSPTSAGSVRRSPLLGMALVFALLCLAGLPPGVVGLVAKVVVFQGAVDGDLTWLAVVLAVNVAIGLVYYLRFLGRLCVRSTRQPPSGPAGRGPRGRHHLTAAAVHGRACAASPTRLVRDADLAEPPRLLRTASISRSAP